MLRRRPFSLPYADQVPMLAALLRDDATPTARPPEAERLVEAALYHKLAGYLARAVERGEVWLPEAPRGRLARIGAVRIVHAAALRRELAALEDDLAQTCGVAPLCIKGPAVADCLYPDPSLRPFADLDLLVPRESLERASAALVARGYRRVQEFHAGFGERHGHDVHLARSVGDRRLDVELHWRVGDDPACVALDHAALCDGASLELDGASVAVPALPQQILCLAVHLVSDRAKRLIWVQDLNLAGRRATDQQWRRTFELADELGLGWVLHRGLDYAAHHLGLARQRPLPPVPPPAWGPLRAVEELDMRASLHIGRLATLGMGARLRYLREVLLPTREGLAGTVGLDRAPAWRLVGRHLRAVALSLGPRRR